MATIKIRVYHSSLPPFEMSFDTQEQYKLVTNALRCNNVVIEEVAHTLNHIKFTKFMRDYIRTGAGADADKIAAIKFVRGITGTGLKETKDFVDAHIF